ncbi:MAG TPA: hypothetical protein VFK05_21275 [Polyangiaceae bacterium]|nr:hypothetical protein [Polyangiaceae bacterium]
MTQRNNATYVDQQRRSPGTGKCVVATNKAAGRLLVAVQPDGSAGSDFDHLKEWLLGLHCDNALFFDGSDSAMLCVRGTFWARPAAWKNAGNTVGLAFYD